MIILEESTANQTIRFTPRTLVTNTISDVSFTFTDTLSKTVETVTGSIAPDKSYASASLAFPFLKEDRSYELTITTLAEGSGIDGDAAFVDKGITYKAYGFDGLAAAETSNFIVISLPSTLDIDQDADTVNGSEIASFIIEGVILNNLTILGAITTSNTIPGGLAVAYGVTEAQVDALEPLGTNIISEDTATADLTYFRADQVRYYPAEPRIPLGTEIYRSLIEVTNQTVAEYSSNNEDYTQYDGPSVNQYTVYQE